MEPTSPDYNDLEYVKQIIEKYQAEDEVLFNKLRPVIEDSTTLEAQFCDELIRALTDYNRLKSVILKFANYGWGRKKLYELIRYIQFNLTLPDEQHDELGEWLGNLMGHCNLNFVLKLPQEPQEQTVFERYFREGPWV